jgi:hypothetical protein
MVRSFEQRAVTAERELRTIATLVRSNTNIRGGSLLQRVRRLLGEHGVTEQLMQLIERLPAVSEVLARERNRTLFWFGEQSLVDDDSQATSDEEI